MRFADKRVFKADVDVWIWADSFTDRFAAETRRAAIGLLQSMALRSAVLPQGGVLRSHLVHHRAADRAARPHGRPRSLGWAGAAAWPAASGWGGAYEPGVVVAERTG